jgi:hypothetical protein
VCWDHYHSASTDKVKHNCHFPAPGRNCMTHRQALQDFPDTSQVSLHKNDKVNFPFLEALKMLSLCMHMHCILFRRVEIHRKKFFLRNVQNCSSYVFLLTLLPNGGSFCRLCPTNCPINNSRMG